MCLPQCNLGARRLVRRHDSNLGFSTNLGRCTCEKPYKGEYVASADGGSRGCEGVQDCSELLCLKQYQLKATYIYIFF